MSKRHSLRIPFLLVCLGLMSSAVLAQGLPGKKDVFKGKLFAPNIILEHQDELGLTKDQFTAIKAAVVEVQASVAEHEWDLREAYMKTLASLDETPIDEELVLENVDAGTSESHGAGIEQVVAHAGRRTRRAQCLPSDRVMRYQRCR